MVGPAGMMVVRHLAKKSKVGSVVKTVTALVALVFIACVAVGALSIKGLLSSDGGGEVAVQAAQQAKYKDVHIVNKTTFIVRAFGCAKGDKVRYDMVGTNPLGERKEFSVCLGSSGVTSIYTR